MHGTAEFEFLFVVENVSLDDSHAVSLLIDEFDGTLSWSRGTYRLTVSGPGADGLDAARRLVSRLAVALPALRVRRLDPELVGVSDIAQRTGHSRQNIQQWVNGERNTTRPFPPPEGCAGRSLVWRWADINEWLRPLRLDDGAIRPSRPEAARIDVMLLDQDTALTNPKQDPVSVLSAQCGDGGE